MSKVYVALDGTEFSTKEAVLEYQKLSELAGVEYTEKRKEFLILQNLSLNALDAVLQFQEECPHEYVTLKACSDTGNYDRSQDSYWYEIRCKCCEKYWTEDQSDSQYRGSSDSKVERIR
ncbi:hypothetical protein pEaSNUABM12_00085 [Erwinia phage pEa_SNUABM_12]|uniref:Uncharacterized protein n=1 Tax=Erwinia phage pEa_SNUABM_12 TaxID=2768773 RepID=A0A7L8ZKV5_9CAUD|nr:hypothetical protein pEaSNUABM12_00085 [Erwinia phage pEa_SNUABM_12]